MHIYGVAHSFNYRHPIFGVYFFLIQRHCPFLFCSLSPGWHEDMDRKMSQSSLGQDQAKFGSKTALNRRVTDFPACFICIG